jgi:ABC-type Fe3+ transport system permease subunit
MHSGTSVGTAVVVTVVLFSLGYARAVWVRAKRDYKNTKAAVKPLRKLMWLAIWRTFQIGLGAVIIYAIIVTWFARDVRDDKNTPLRPARILPTVQATPHPSCPHGWRRC